MRRLTKKDAWGSYLQGDSVYSITGVENNPERFRGEAVDRLAAYEDLGTIDHIRELVEAEQSGRLDVLPCKVGDTVYFTFLGRIIEKQVCSIISQASFQMFYCAGTSMAFSKEAIGETVFLSREEAEAALNDQS